MDHLFQLTFGFTHRVVPLLPARSRLLFILLHVLILKPPIKLIQVMLTTN